MANPQPWPSRIFLVRHGESAGNVAREQAYAAGFARIDIAERDVDVPLSRLGEQQARALGKWFEQQPESERPDRVLTSPYLRAVRTAEIIREAGGLGSRTTPPALDERLREREFGILDRLTRSGIQEFYPEQAEARRRLGKFYHRPPGGESWCDVILRLRSAMDTLSLHYSGLRVLIVAHEVVIMCFRYLLEELDEATLMKIGAESDCANCGVTDYCYVESDGPPRNGHLQLKRFNFTVPLEREGAAVTTAPDLPVAPK